VKIILNRLSPFDGRLVRPLRLSLLILAALSPLACSPTVPSEPEADTISRELFISAYVELRVAALQAPGQELTLAARDRALASVEVTENQVLGFVEAHGKDVPFMRRLWEEVDSILEDRRSPGDRPGPGDLSDPGD
jgi:hypothetical protein